MVYVVNGVLARGVDMLLEKDLVGFALQKMEIHPLMLLIQILLMIFQTFSPTLYNPNTNHTRASYVGTILTMIKDYRNEKIDIRFRRECESMIDELNESDEFIKSSIEDLVLIPSESEDTSEHDSDCDLPSCDDFSPINVYEEKSVTFSNPLFDSNDNFTSSDNESLSDEDVLEDIECKVSYDSNFDEPTLLVTPLSDSNEDECLTPGDDIELLLHHDSSTLKISVASILEGFTDEPPLEENDNLFDLESKMNDWKKILYDAPINDLIFNPGGDIDDIDAFLDIDISTNIKDSYYDSKGDTTYLESLLIDDTIPSLPPKVFL
ncbi:hypothetical protein Tco_0084025 [Tanacetum coccineum]